MFKNISLEISLKPFKKTDSEYIRNICHSVFQQWRPLLKNREVISIMLWASDGSEILDYDGNLDKSFEWCYFIGNANKPLLSKDEPRDIGLHDKAQLYTKNPPIMTYRVLKEIIATFKEEGKKFFPDSEIRVGETFDIGPEFAISDFKYNRHIEISSGTQLDSFGFVDSTAILKGDTRKYAAYPNGIPDGTPFGTFLGKQSNVFLKDMGFDYLWLSNGLGFSADPWDTTGKIFDGENFHAENLDKTRNKVFEFWKLFREACPDIQIQTRGTNNSVGIDYATDGVPLYEIYNGNLNITPPPNSPWAALNDNFGLELMGHMTRICELPSDKYMFRFYIHDPWWVNSPWYDRYEENPHDIYLAMSVTRVDEEGKIQPAEILNILSIDNSFGELPDNCVYEPLPHLLKAEKNSPDAIAPLVWVYPMREYTTAKEERLLNEMYYGDKFISESINFGLPLNCVVSTDNFLKHDLSIYNKSILISPVPENNEVFDKLESFSKNGGNVIYYGSNEALKTLKTDNICVDFASDPNTMRQTLEKFGYLIKFELKKDTKKPCALTVSRRDNAYYFSVYNPNTTTDTLMKFPLGVPVFTADDIEIKDGIGRYRFPKSQNKECRIFVEQKDGVVKVKEDAVVSGEYHRKLLISGLEDATVCFFPENHCLDTAKVSFDVSDRTPEYDDRWIKVEDKKYGTYYKAEHISGRYAFYFPYKHNYFN